MTAIQNWAPHMLVEKMQEQGIQRACLVYDRELGRLKASHEMFEPLAQFITSDKRDFLQHEGIFWEVGETSKTLHTAFVHKTKRGAAAGGVRYWPYETVEALFRDGLRLSLGMTRKNALAGLWWGGGKGVICRMPESDYLNPDYRKTVYQEYGRFMTSIAGCYITAEDAGTNTEDMGNIFTQTRFTTCIPEQLGGSGNPSVPTAKGVIAGLEAALDFLQMGDFRGKTVAIQGAGNVGRPLLKFLLECKVGKVIVSDINIDRCERIHTEFGSEQVTVYESTPGEDSILFEAVDMLAPCALGAVLNPRTIPQINAKIVCGAANNQLEDYARDDQALTERGICYVPDFLTNRMGIVNCADEQYGYVHDDPKINVHLSKEYEFGIHQMTQKVLQLAKDNDSTPGQQANLLADKLANEPHPIWGHRGQAIIDSLWENRWYAG